MLELEVHKIFTKDLIKAKLNPTNSAKLFLYISKGSCGEVRSMLILALELGKINKTDFDRLYKQSEDISKMLSGLIKTL